MQLNAHHQYRKLLIVAGKEDHFIRDDVSVSSRTTKGDDEDTQSSVQLRKRNLRQKVETTTEPPIPSLPPVSYEKPPNPYETYLQIRKQVTHSNTVNL